MDQIDNQRQIVQKILLQIAEEKHTRSDKETSTELFVDVQRDNYMVMSIGWRGTKRIQEIIAFIRLRNGQIYIEEDWTEDGLISRLEVAGIKSDQVLLAFNPPSLRVMVESS